MTLQHDLVILTACADQREALHALLTEREASLGIRPIRVEIKSHPRRDPGCFHEAPDVIRGYQSSAARALVVFDHEGSGQEDRTAIELEADLRGRLAVSGWGDRADVVVIDPELENWVWANSPHVAKIAGWSKKTDALKVWLRDEGFWPEGAVKPTPPKGAFERLLRETRTPRSPSLYAEIGRKVTLKGCTDTAFHRFVAIVQSWFPAEDGKAKI